MGNKREAPHRCNGAAPPGAAPEGGEIWDHVPHLAEEFPGFEISAQPSWRGLSLVAVRRDVGAPGVRVVITTDPAEMREALLGDAAGCHPGR